MELYRLSEKGNYVALSDIPNLKVRDSGRGNVIVLDKNAIISESVIEFTGNDGLIFLGSSKDIKVRIQIGNKCNCFIGSNNFFNGLLNISVTEKTNFFLGSDCLISFNIWIRTCDAHMLYDCESGKRINFSKSVYIGDHVWLGQGATILKGSHIGSGSVIGSMSVCGGKICPSNCLMVGNPAEIKKKGIFFTRQSAHRFTEQETEKYMEFDDDAFIFCPSSQNQFMVLEEKLSTMVSMKKRMLFLQEISCSQDKNRFAL